MRAGIALSNRCRKRVGILTGGSITENPSQYPKQSTSQRGELLRNQFVQGVGSPSVQLKLMRDASLFGRRTDNGKSNPDG